MLCFFNYYVLVVFRNIYIYITWTRLRLALYDSTCIQLYVFMEKHWLDFDLYNYDLDKTWVYMAGLDFYSLGFLLMIT